MILTSKCVRGLSAGVLLLLPLFSTAQVDLASAADEMKGSPCEIPDGYNAMRAEEAQKEGTHLVAGEVMRVEGTTYVVKEQSGEEVRLETDQKKTVKPEINQGDHISASVNDQNHALWIRSNKETDRRTEHASADCNPN